MHEDRQIREALEACRPGSDDLSLPELAIAARRVADDPATRDLFERTQQSDALVGEAFHDIPLPAGLQDRLLAALEAAEALDQAEGVDQAEAVDVGGRALAASPAPSVAAAQAVSVTGRHAPAWSRWLLATGAAAAAVMACVMAWQLLSPAAPLNSEQVLQMASELHEVADSPNSNWNANLAAAPKDHPFSSRLQVAPVAWQFVPGLSDSHAVAYRLSEEATLHVFEPRQSVVGLPAAPPLAPQHASGRSIGAWTSGKLVYALVVEGPPQAYQSLVKPSAGLALLFRPQSLPSRHDS